VAPRDAQHAYSVLRGLTMPSGGMVAAATMSLPERAEQGRNYDYRYTWIRDQCYAGIAAVSFTTARILSDGDKLRPAYTVEGGVVPREQRLRLPGYPGGQTVVRGNWVTRQFQLDSFGEALQLLAEAARLQRLDMDGHHAMQVAVSAIECRWQHPEAGLWELHEDWWTHSRLACVAGLRAAARVAHHGDDATAKTSLADAILAETSRRCLHHDGHWQRSPTRTGPDAALLQPPVRGALAHDDPRTAATLDAVRKDLTEDGYVYRFRHSPRPLGEDEGAFLLCGFIMAIAEHHCGNDIAALRRFERTRAACGPPGLFSEEYDVRQRQLRGNLPQAFVHALLLEASVRLRPATQTPPGDRTPRNPFLRGPDLGTITRAKPTASRSPRRKPRGSGGHENDIRRADPPAHTSVDRQPRHLAG
jgi:alpha,alpha-trehalase